MGEDKVKLTQRGHDGKKRFGFHLFIGQENTINIIFRTIDYLLIIVRISGIPRHRFGMITKETLQQPKEEK